jgi:ABC-type sugar transport system permease subunit
VLSFTDWNGIRFGDLAWVGFENYVQIFTVFERDFFQAIINNAVLLLFLFVGPTALGIAVAYLLDRDVRGTRFYQGVFFTPVVLSLAVVGFMWQSVIYSPENGLATQLVRRRQPVEWLGNQSFLVPIGDRFGVAANFVAILVAIAWRHTGYIMVLYLAGLKSVDSSLREAAMLDGSNEWQVFRHVVFPSLKPINVVVAVITVIEALRAFDIIYVLNVPRRTEVLSILTTEQPARGRRRQRRPRVRLRDDPVRPLLRLRDLVRHQPLPEHAGRSRLVSSAKAGGTGIGNRRPPLRLGRVLLYAFLSLMAFVWIVPIAGAVFASLRPFAEPCPDGFFSWPSSLTLENYRPPGSRATSRASTEHGGHPGAGAGADPLLLEHGGVRRQPLLLAVQHPAAVGLHGRQPAAAADHHPAALPVLQPGRATGVAVELGPAERQRAGLILIHVAFQSGFCTFVLSNYMKLLPKSLNEAARMDGASAWKQYWQIIMPLTLPAIAALATARVHLDLQRLLWAVVLEQQGADRPITSSLANLGGEFVRDDNLIAAASMYVALPTLIVYFALQRYFIAGLTIGAEKG